MGILGLIVSPASIVYKPKRLLIECPVSDRALSSDPNCDFEYVGPRHFLKLWVSEPNQYGVIKNFVASEPGAVIRNLGAPIVTVRAYYHGIDYKSLGLPKWKYDLLETLWRSTANVEYSTRSRLALLDYAMPEAADETAARIANAEPYTERLVAIEELKPNSAALAFNGQNWLKEGFTVRFVELRERFE